MNDTKEPDPPPESPELLLHPPLLLLQPSLPPPPFHQGQWWFSNKIHTRLTPSQHALLSTRPSPTASHSSSTSSPQPNKCRKLRPWLILSLLPNNKALVICSTTRENRGAAGLSPAQARSFLPIAPTPEFLGRAQVRVVLDERGVFVGRSLVFLEVVRVVCLGVFGGFIGAVGVLGGVEAMEGLERVWKGRREWVEENGGGGGGCDVNGGYTGGGGGGGGRGRGRGRGRGKGRGRGSWRGRGGVSNGSGSGSGSGGSSTCAHKTT
ncbi:hypothetical protein L873DRAFT_1505398 [Choiromyces venosus 120613-1]|uniref:Uncharacterized protein n=1 Tax=Choiromyces venosus 120613-1 TaxID=1336337 RepID=A0A3N4JAM5_9PEZI|nr:hypothetical protein L873DRAFT_1505398 [Choiromyces venosus 120613-1]